MNPVHVSLQPNSATAGFFRSVSPGEAVRGTVIQLGSGTAVRLRGTTLPLPPSAGLPVGTPVEAVLYSRSGTTSFEIRPLPMPTGTGAGGTVGQGGLENLLAAVLRGMNAGNRTSPANLSGLIPPQLPMNAEYLRHIVMLFTMRAPLAAQLGEIAAHIQSAVQAGWTPPDAVRSLLEHFQKWQALDGADRLRHAVNWMRANGEAALGQSGTRTDDLLTQLRVLMKSDAFFAHLRGKRAAQNAARTLQEAIGRIESHQLQNLHSIEQPYAFFEVPFGPNEAPLHIHWFRDRASREGAAAHRLYIDVSLSRLGNVWIELQAASFCRCTIRIEDGEAIREAERHTAQLVQSLEQCGFHPVTLRVLEWNGDRVEALHGLFNRKNAMDVKI